MGGGAGAGAGGSSPISRRKVSSRLNSPAGLLDGGGGSSPSGWLLRLLFLASLRQPIGQRADNDDAPRQPTGCRTSPAANKAFIGTGPER